MERTYASQYRQRIALRPTRFEIYRRSRGIFGCRLALIQLVGIVKPDGFEGRKRILAEVNGTVLGGCDPNAVALYADMLRTHRTYVDCFQSTQASHILDLDPGEIL